MKQLKKRGNILGGVQPTMMINLVHDFRRPTKKSMEILVQIVDSSGCKTHSLNGIMLIHLTNITLQNKSMNVMFHSFLKETCLCSFIILFKIPNDPL